jgi:hypothetical protein
MLCFGNCNLVACCRHRRQKLFLKNNFCNTGTDHQEEEDVDDNKQQHLRASSLQPGLIEYLLFLMKSRHDMMEIAF